VPHPPQRYSPLPPPRPARPSASHPLCLLWIFLPTSGTVCLTTRIHLIASRTCVVGFEKDDLQPIFTTTFACVSWTPSLAPFLRFAAHNLHIQQAFGRYTCVTILHRSIIPGSQDIILRLWLFVLDRLFRSQLPSPGPLLQPHHTRFSRSEDYICPAASESMRLLVPESGCHFSPINKSPPRPPTPT
jgi:hypothetical protein